jgi:glycosyltransferase involved in cell wall biosynthesis
MGGIKFKYLKLMKNKILYVVNVDWFFLSHRKELAIAAKNAGYDVFVVTKDTGKKEEITSFGLKFVNLPMDRASKNIFKELYTFFFLAFLYLKERPAIVHHVGLKAILIGGLASKVVKVQGVVNAISGLGISFSKENMKSLSTRFFVNILRFSHYKNNLRVIFQNQEDFSIFIDKKIIPESQARFIKGSGVDLKEFSYSPEPKVGKIKVILTARMIVEKGIIELVEAAKLLKTDYKDKVQFILCGGIDANPKALSEEQINKLCDEEYIIWLGHRQDIKELLMASHIVAFPSYYKEGLPKSLIEAAAIGRPIVTTNSVGCKDVVEDGVNGFLIPVKDNLVLAEKLKQLIDDKDLRVEFGENSRIIAERDFSIENVIEKHLMIYSQITEC